MKIVHLPDLTDRESGEGPVRKFLQWLSEEHPDLWNMWNVTLGKAKRPQGLEMLQRQHRVEKLKYRRGLWEFKIPPTRRGGVARIYFCHGPTGSGQVILLAAEWKKKAEASPHKLEAAARRF